MFWNTSWFGHENIAFNFLDEKNHFRPTALAVKLWNDHWQPNILKVSNTAETSLLVYALKSTDGKLSLFIVNKTKNTVGSPVVLNAEKKYAIKSIEQLTDGAVIENLSGSKLSIHDNTIFHTSFKPYSITVILFE